MAGGQLGHRIPALHRAAGTGDRRTRIGALTCYTGNPLAHSFSLGRYAGVLLGMSGIPVSYSPGTVDQWPKNLSSHLMYGN